ncbi:Acyl carrier protein phosphopantetheine domain profile [Propionibacterium ruminifibrarum]|uniref:Acyl carrier protein phosphopantetheine domain profile n=2 Tax=Propionibacterium ruminifibrarum TaxID=1962131 RepID=A0A375HYK2_9ACTN|nr:Acyl carrier protein phosphopantetheine domain profile [Propionibacterium ruminifibrarum]
MMSRTEQTVREALAEVGNLDEDAMSLAADASLADAGLTSHAAVSLLLEIEDRLGIEFPPEQMTPETMASIRAIEAGIEALS